MAVQLPWPLHPRHGIHQQDAQVPARVPASARRTSNIDSVRPDGPRGPVVVRAAARDLVTATDGAPSVAAEAGLRGEIDYMAGYRITSMVASPSDRRIRALLGMRASSGFRRAVTDCVPGHVALRTPLYHLLDDLPAALLVSGVATLHLDASERPAGPRLQQADMCAGWISDGTLMVAAGKGQRDVPTGPISSLLESADDPVAWHDMEPLPPHATRRRRRIDVRVVGARLLVDAHFRDSYVTPTGVETSIHEYTVTALADAESLRLLEVRAKAHALPFVECNVAPESAGDIEGRTLGELRTFVRTSMTGVRTCTHLNDTLRTLDDVIPLSKLARATET